MEKLMQRSTSKKQLLVNTITHFNSKNRAVNFNGTCFYRTKDGKACAIGREIPTELATRFANNYFQGGTFITAENNFKLLPQRLKNMGKYFLNDIQHLHDTPKYWNAKGLTDTGKKWVKHICIAHNVSYKAIEPYLK